MEGQAREVRGVCLVRQQGGRGATTNIKTTISLNRVSSIIGKKNGGSGGVICVPSVIVVVDDDAFVVLVS